MRLAAAAARAAGESAAGPLPAKMLASRMTARPPAPREMLVAVAGLMAPATSTAADLAGDILIAGEAESCGAVEGLKLKKENENPPEKNGRSQGRAGS